MATTKATKPAHRARGSYRRERHLCLRISCISLVDDRAGGKLLRAPHPAGSEKSSRAVSTRRGVDRRPSRTPERTSHDDPPAASHPRPRCLLHCPDARRASTASAAPVKTGYARSGDLDLYYEVHGSGGTPLVVLQGSFCTIEVCFGQMLPTAGGQAPGDPDRPAGPRSHAARQDPPVHGHADEDRLARRDEEARHQEGGRAGLQHRRRGRPGAGDHESRAGEQARAAIGRLRGRRRAQGDARDDAEADRRHDEADARGTPRTRRSRPRTPSTSWSRR